MKTIFEVIETIVTEMKTDFFIRKLSQVDIVTNAHQRKVFLARTDSGNYRYPQRDIFAATVAIDTTIKNLLSDFTVFCYKIDGELYTTYNRNKPFKYSFKGNPADITMQNYREAGKEPRLLELGKNDSVVSGFYYPCGKPFFVSGKGA